MTVLFFASPVVYAFDHIPERARALLLLQPFAQLLRLATDVIYWNRFPSRACLTSIAMHLLVLMALAAWAILYSRGRIAEKI
jgi:ABC-type polysaccharide/polyol phosphate export permease